jgi:hypothetical protein
MDLEQRWHHMSSVAEVLAASYLLFFYPLAVFRYRIAEGTLEMEWIVFGFIRVSRRRF